MIVVVGNPIARAAELGGGVGGAAARAAMSAAKAGAAVQLVGKAGDDPLGDEVLLALAAAGVGHAAVLRDPAHPTPLAVPDEAEGASSTVLDGDAEPGVQIAPADPGDRPTLEAADVELALRYLPEQRAIIVAEPQSDRVVAVVAEAAAYAGAALVLVVSPGWSGGAPQAALVVEAPPEDPDGAFGSMLGQLGAALDRGESAGEAFRTLTVGAGIAPAAD